VSRRAVWAAVVVAAVAAGAVDRWWVATHPVGTLTADGSVIGLMALHLLHHGQLSAYMWGQAYGGSLEALATAAVFLVAGTGVAQLLATTALSSALAAVALWRTGRRIVGESAAAIGALAFWVWPASFIWRSLKPGGTYQLGLAVSLCAVGALVRLREPAAGWRRAAIAGVWSGLALWSSPMSLQLLIPATLFCLPALARLGRRLGAVVAGGVVGGAPILGYGAMHGWANLHAPGVGQSVFTGFGSRLVQFFRIEMPLVMSLRVQRSLDWVGGDLGRALAVLAAVAFVAALVTVLTGRAARCRLPVLTLLVLPLLFALNTLADNVGQARYVYFGSTMGALLVGVGLERAGPVLARRWRARPSPLSDPPLWPVLLALLAVLGTAALLEGPPSRLVGFQAPDAPLPTDDHALQTLVREHHLHDGYANYWIAYRITFETDERTVVTPVDYDRYPPLAARVAASPRPAYLFLTASATFGRFLTWCHDHSVPVTVWRAGAFAVVRPAVRVLPSELPRRLLR
jgi:hypothetical protein